MKSAKERFAYNLKRLREEKGISQEAIAKMCGTSKTTVSNWETGKQFISLQKLDLLSEILQCANSDLFFDNEISKPIEKDYCEELESEFISRVANTILCLEAIDAQEYIPDILSKSKVPETIIDLLIENLEHDIAYMQKDLEKVKRTLFEINKYKNRG